MPLTPTQLQALKQDILADATLAGWPNTPDNNFSIADMYNLTAAPAFVVWRTAVDVTDLLGSGVVWTEVDGLSVGKARIWDWMSRLGRLDPSKANVRAGLLNCFGASSGSTTGITPLLKRPARRVERLFAMGAGTDAAPATLVYEGTITYIDVTQARNS